MHKFKNPLINAYILHYRQSQYDTKFNGLLQDGRKWIKIHQSQPTILAIRTKKLI